MAPASFKPSDLAIPAAKQAISNAGIQPEDIDSVYFCGIERDYPEPATAHIIQQALGIKAKTAFDLSNACYGFIEGMELASKSIRLGESTTALIVTGEIPTRVLNGVVKQLKNGVSMSRAKQIIGALTVGDAGGAVILSKGDAKEKSGFQFFNKLVDSQHYDKCLYEVGPDGVPKGQMDMGPISKAAFSHHSNLVPKTLKGLECPQFDWTLLHQTGIRQVQRICTLKGIDKDKTIITYDKLGNLTTATFAVSFNQLENSGKVKPGDLIGCCFAGSGLVVGHTGYIY